MYKGDRVRTDKRATISSTEVRSSVEKHSSRRKEAVVAVTTGIDGNGVIIGPVNSFHSPLDQD
jgi:hypothetical protein